MVRYQVKFTKTALRDLSKAVSRYNSMLTRFEKTGGRTVAKRASVAEIKEQVSNTRELREYIKRLSDYKKVSDFQTGKAKGYRFATTKGERRTITRLDVAARRRYKKEIAELEKQKASADAETLINVVLPKIAELKAKPTVISNIKNRYIFEKVLKRYEREKLQPKTEFGSVAPVTLDHYLAAFSSMGLENVEGGQQIFHAIANMSESDFSTFISNNDDLSIDTIYDIGIQAQTKVNQIGARLGLDLSSLVGETDAVQE